MLDPISDLNAYMRRVAPDNTSPMPIILTTYPETYEVFVHVREPGFGEYTIEICDPDLPSAVDKTKRNIRRRKWNELHGRPNFDESQIG